MPVTILSLKGATFSYLEDLMNFTKQKLLFQLTQNFFHDLKISTSLISLEIQFINFLIRILHVQIRIESV